MDGMDPREAAQRRASARRRAAFAAALGGEDDVDEEELEEEEYGPEFDEANGDEDDGLDELGALEGSEGAWGRVKRAAHPGALPGATAAERAQWEAWNAQWADSGVPLEPFNMRSEREAGFFDLEGPMPGRRCAVHPVAACLRSCVQQAELYAVPTEALE